MSDLRDVKEASVEGWHIDWHIWLNLGTSHRALPITQFIEQKER